MVKFNMFAKQVAKSNLFGKIEICVKGPGKDWT